MLAVAGAHRTANVKEIFLEYPFVIVITNLGLTARVAINFWCIPDE
jgi:hypothetical protein